MEITAVFNSGKNDTTVTSCPECIFFSHKGSFFCAVCLLIQQAKNVFSWQNSELLENTLSTVLYHRIYIKLSADIFGRGLGPHEEEHGIP